jgi:catechol-2,3-dioxygenase
MLNKVTISIDVANMKQALQFYTEALSCEFKTKYSDLWQVISIGGTHIHLQEKKS